MEQEIVNGKIAFIGRGEKLTLKILKIFFPLADFQIQVPLDLLCTLECPSQRQLKETIDIVMRYKKQLYAVRLQDSSHNGPIKSRADEAQKKELELNGVKTIDLNQWECKNLFSDNFNYMTMLEITTALFQAEVPI